MSSSAERLARLVTPRWLFVSDDYAESIVRNRILISVGTLLLLIVTLTVFAVQYIHQTSGVLLTETFVTAYLSAYADNPNVDCVRVAAVSGQIRFTDVEPEFGCYSTPMGTCADFTMDYGGSGLIFNSTYYASYDECVSAYTQHFTNATGELEVSLRDQIVLEPCTLDVTPAYLANTLGDGVYMVFPNGTVATSCTELIEPFDIDAWSATVAPSIVAQMCAQFQGDINPPFLCTSSTSVSTLTALSSAANLAGFAFSISCIGLIVMFWLLRLLLEKNRKSSFLRFLMMDGFFRFRFDDRVRPYFGLKALCCFLLLFPLLLLGAFAGVFSVIYNDTFQQTSLSNSINAGQDCQMLSSYTDSQGALGRQSILSSTMSDEVNNINISWMVYTNSFVNAYFPYHSDCVSLWENICTSVPLFLQSTGGDSEFTFLSFSSLGNSSTTDVVFNAEITEVTYFNVLAGDGQAMTEESALALWDSRVCSEEYNSSIVSMNCAAFLDDANPPFICSQSVRLYSLWGAIGQSFAAVIVITTVCALIIPKLVLLCCAPGKKEEVEMIPMNRLDEAIDPEMNNIAKADESNARGCVSVFSKVPIPKAFTTVKNDIPVVGYELVAVILSILVYVFCFGVLLVSFIESPSETTELVLSTTDLGTCTQLEFNLYVCDRNFKYSIWTRLSAAFGNASLAFALLSFLMIVLLNSAVVCKSNQDKAAKPDLPEEPKVVGFPGSSDDNAPAS